MKRIASAVLTTALVFGGLLGFQSSALAASCPATCGMQKRACQQVARVTKLACKQDCRTGSEPTALGACMRGCASGYRAAGGGCRSEHASCQEILHPAGGVRPVRRRLRARPRALRAGRLHGCAGLSRGLPYGCRSAGVWRGVCAGHADR